jgi:hypothetical protein
MAEITARPNGMGHTSPPQGECPTALEHLDDEAAEPGSVVLDRD